MVPNVLFHESCRPMLAENAIVLDSGLCSIGKLDAMVAMYSTYGVIVVDINLKDLVGYIFRDRPAGRVPNVPLLV